MDVLAKAGAMLDEGFMEVRKDGFRSLAVCSQLSLPGREMERL